MAFNLQRFAFILAITSLICLAGGWLSSGDWHQASRDAVRGGLQWAILVYWIYAVITRELSRPKFASKAHGSDGATSQKAGRHS